MKIPCCKTLLGVGICEWLTNSGTVEVEEVPPDAAVDVDTVAAVASARTTKKCNNRIPK